MVAWKLLFSKKAQTHAKNLKKAGLEHKAEKILDEMKLDPYNPLHGFEKLVGDLKGFYSRRINLKHRIVYQVDKEKLTIFVHAMWSHYEQ